MMSRLITRSVHTFRTKFQLENIDFLHWFPGHMGKGMTKMEQKLKNVDLIIEVHDARIPLSGRNIKFENTILGLKPHILVLNKMDLTTYKHVDIVKDTLMRHHGVPHILFTNGKDRRCKGVRQLLPMAIDLINSSDRFNRAKADDFCIMVIGVPNVGKSTLINNLRNTILGRKNAAPVGGVAGVTRAVQNRIKISEDPPIYILDTPGILDPVVRNLEAGMRLALCGCLQDHLVGPVVIADYLLYWLNKHQNFRYVDLLGLQEPTDSITLALAQAALNMRAMNKILTHQGYQMVPNYVSAAHSFMKAFREGKLGALMLDQEEIEPPEQQRQVK